MPRYEYHCTYCNVDEIINKKMSDYNPNEECQVCGKPMTRKVENMVCGYQAKCSGFYGKKS